MQKYKFGWRPELPDRRDYPFAKTFRVTGKLPDSVDLRTGCSQIEDQGELGSCTAQALVGALEFLEIRHAQARLLRGFEDLSRLFVYLNERIALGERYSDSGAYLRTGIKSLAKQGCCRESLWPYIVSKFADEPPKECYDEALEHQITAYYRLSTLRDMKSCLAMGLPFVGGFTCYDSLMSDEVAKTGNIPLPGEGESVIGGHAIMFVGYDDKTGLVIIRNSWGESWGQAGYGTLPYAYLESRDLSDDFWCIQTVESNQYCARYEITEATV